MDEPSDWSFDNLKDFLPPGTTTALARVYARLLSPDMSDLFDKAQTQLSTHLSTLLTALQPLYTALETQFSILLASAPPGLVAAGTLLLVAIVVIQILSIIRRLILFGTRLVFQLVFWACVGLIVSAVWQRGVGRTARDLAVVGGKVVGWSVGAAEVWWAEYEKAQAAERQASASSYGAGRAGGGQRGGPSSGSSGRGGGSGNGGGWW
ncbi:hypothetical protein B0J18DRAFT_422305 [Chaetomium sp. MPI-SDFR-AT-0129]|nr:hypothetical protein B0J18DRAFT_422305 [Chaetomium sp. MPI-SDFR-AT-0129]